MKVAKTRRRLMKELATFPEDMTGVAAKFQSHQQLTNPAVQYIYVYLTKLVLEVATTELGKPVSELSILDWGCSRGHISVLLDQWGAKPTPCDVVNRFDSAFGLETPLVEHYGLKIVPLTDEVILPFESGSFDVVISMGVLEHVRDDRASLLELRRILKPSGLLFCFFLPSTLSWTQKVARMRGDTYHDRFYSVNGTRKLVTESGFEVLDIWRRQLLPKNQVRYPFPKLFEHWDQLLVEWSPLAYLATNIEFIARKPAGR